MMGPTKKNTFLRKKRSVYNSLSFLDFLENVPKTSRQLELEEKVKARINLKLKKGVYKLTTNEYNKIDFWRRFATITKTNGTSLKGYVCCTFCSIILKSRRNNPNLLKEHVCFSEDPPCGISASTQDSHYTEDEISEDSLEGEIDNITINVSIWESFDIALMDDGTATNGLISCRQCQRELQYDSTSRTIGERQTHICLGSSSGQRECLKLMPTQDEIESKIRLIIAENVKSDIFKLKLMPNRKSYIWKVFGVITKADGSIVNGWIQCSECAKIFKYQHGKYTTTLYKHECLVKINTAEREECREYVDKIITLDALPLEREIENTETTIWDIFDLILVDDGDTVDGLISCRQCNVVLKYNYCSTRLGQRQTHTCLAASEGECSLKMMPTQHEVAEKVKLEIRKKIKAGLFKLTANRSSKSHFWKVLAMIAKADDSVINGYIYCTKCAKILKCLRSQYQTHIYNHTCLKKIIEETEDVVQRPVKRTSAASRERVIESILTTVWESFDLTLVDDGETVVGLITCRQCNMKMEYDYDTRTTDLRQRHTCLAESEGEHRFKAMPTKHEIEQKIKLEISKKIKSGIFKVTKNETKRSLVWKVLAMITKADDSVIKGYIYCTNCTQIFKNSSDKFRSFIYKHRCLREIITGEVEEPADISPEPANKTIAMWEDSSSSLEHEMENNIISFWETFDLTLAIDGDTVAGLMTCRQCNVVLKYNYTTTRQQTHNCLGESFKVLPHQDEVEEKIKLEISKQINAGHFKLTMNQIDKALIWKVMALITKNTDGTTISGYVCCIKCNTVLKAEGVEIKALQSHTCYLDHYEGGGDDSDISGRSLLDDSSYSKMSTVPDYHAWQKKMKADIQTKISSGEYKLRKWQHSKSLKRKVFAKIAKKDGTLLREYIYCTKCKSLLKYNGRIRPEHKCLRDSYLQTKNSEEEDEQLNSCQEEDETSETSVKRFRMENIDEDGSTTDNSEKSVQKEKAYDKENDINKRETENIQNNIEKLISNDNDPLWLRFELISLADGSTLEKMVSCRKCRMVLQYDGSTKLHLEDHKCFSFAPLPSKICNDDSDLEFIDEPRNMKKTTNKAKRENEMGEDCVAICGKGEFIYVDLTENNSSDPLEITVNEDANQKHMDELNEPHAKDNIIIIEEFDASAICANTKINNSYSLNNTEDLGETSNSDKQNINENFIEDKGKASNTDATVSKLEESDLLRKLLNSWKQRGIKYVDSLNIQDSLTDSAKLLQHIQQMAAKKRLEIKSKIKELSNPQTASISIDIWRDTRLEKDFFKATLHYNKSYELGNILLEVQHMDLQQSSAKTLRNKLENLLKDFGIEQIKNIIFISDIDQHLAKDLDNSFIHLKCSRYLFERVLETAIENTLELKDTVNNCKQVLQHLPTTNDGNLLQMKTETDSKSYYYILKSITNNWLKVKDMLTVKKESFCISPEFTISRLQNLIKLCQKFELIFKRLEDKQTPSLCFVILSIERLKAISETITNDTPEIKSLKANLLKNIQEIWLTNITIWHKAACFLYPPAKQQQENDLNEIKQFCIKQMRESNSTSATKDMDSLAEETDDISFFFPYLIESKNDRTTNNLEEEEINRYGQQSIMIDTNFNVLQWWQNNSTKYPLLSRLALQILSIPASIKRSQLIFPQTENLIDNVALLLSSKDMENILFLNSCS